jgi:hypothetical protein
VPQLVGVSLGVLHEALRSRSSPPPRRSPFWTFDGRHKSLAAIFGAWAGGAPLKADLSFTTRHEAAKVPDALKANHRLNNAVGIIIATHNVDVAEGSWRLEEAAALAVEHRRRGRPGV